MTKTSDATGGDDFVPPIQVEGELLVLIQFVDKVKEAPSEAGLIVGDIVELERPGGELGNDVWAQVAIAVASGAAVEMLKYTSVSLAQWAKRNGLRWRSEDPPDPDAPTQP